MATRSLSVRIPEDALAELEKMAGLKGQKVSDLVRDIILERLTSGTAGGNQLVMARLEALEANIMGSQSWLADFVITSLRAVGEAQYQSQMAADNTDEIMNYLAVQKPLDAKSKKERQQVRAKEALRHGDSLVQKATALTQAASDEGQSTL